MSFWHVLFLSPSVHFVIQGIRRFPLCQWTIFLLKWWTKHLSILIFHLRLSLPGMRNQQACKNLGCQNCELEIWAWKTQSYADVGRTLLQMHALTMKEVRKSSSTLPDKTPNSYSAKVFQATNRFRNSVCALTQPWKLAPLISQEHPPLLQSNESPGLQQPPSRNLVHSETQPHKALTRTRAEGCHHLGKRENTLGKYCLQYLHWPLNKSSWNCCGFFSNSFLYELRRS